MTSAGYRDFGTPRVGSDFGMAPGRCPGFRPWFGACRSRRNTIQAAAATIVATTAKRPPTPQITQFIPVSCKVSQV